MTVLKVHNDWKQASNSSTAELKITLTNEQQLILEYCSTEPRTLGEITEFFKNKNMKVKLLQELMFLREQKFVSLKKTTTLGFFKKYIYSTTPTGWEILKKSF